MTDAALPLARPWFQVSGFRFRWFTLPAVVAAGLLMQTMLVPARELARWVARTNPQVFHHQAWAFVCLAEVFQIVTGVAAVLLLRRFAPRAPTYLRWPARRSDWWLATGFGVAFALIMLAADFWPQMLLHRPFPNQGYEITPIGVPGWMLAMFGAGPNEELVFRSFLVGLLTLFVPGRVRAGNFDVPLSGVAVALLFGAAHYHSFFVESFAMALAQQLYAVGFAIVYVWLMERADSVIAPMVTHSVSDMGEVAATMALMTW
jgi:hypothetical protein